MSISQSIEAPLTTRDCLTMSGSLSSHNGNGTGGFMITGRRLINKGWLELDMGAGGGPIISMRGSRNLTNKVYCTGGGTLNFRQNGIIPGLVGSKATGYFLCRVAWPGTAITNLIVISFILALAVQLDKHTVGYLTYNAGIQSSMSTVLEHSTDKQHLMLTCSIGIPHCFVAASYMRKIVEHEMKLRLSAKSVHFANRISGACALDL